MDLIHPEGPGTRARTVIEAMAQGRDHDRVSCAGSALPRRECGATILWSGQGRAPRDGCCFYMVGKDITERRRLDQELENRAERLERINAELQDFAYIASHDLSETAAE